MAGKRVPYVHQLLRMRILRADGQTLTQIAKNLRVAKPYVRQMLGLGEYQRGPHGYGVPQRCEDCRGQVIGRCFACLSREQWVYDPPRIAEIVWVPGQVKRASVIALAPDLSEYLVEIHDGSCQWSILHTPHWLPAEMLQFVPARMAAS